MPSYSNGYIPESLLVIFARGANTVDGSWFHGLPPATYARHKALVARARNRTGRTLTISDGWGAYRPYAAQLIARSIYGNGAAYPGTSSHGGFWEGRQTAAMDYSNWGWVYDWDRGAFFEDCRAVGLSPGLISPERGYPDEPWHVNDLDPWSAVPSGLDSTPLEGDSPPPIIMEEDMPGIRVHHQVFTNGNQAYVVETSTGFYIPEEAHLAALVKAYEIKLDKLPWLNEYDWNAVADAKARSNSGYPQAPAS